MSLELIVTHADPDDPLCGKGEHLLRLEADIHDGTLKALTARHKSGGWMLRFRAETKGGPRLPAKTRQALVDLLGISSREVNHRMKLAEKYQVTELSNVLHNFPSWHDVCKHALYDKKPAQPKTTVIRPKRTGIPISTIARDFARSLPKPSALRPVDVKALTALVDAINQLLATAPKGGARS